MGRRDLAMETRAGVHLSGELKGVRSAENFPMKWKIGILDVSDNQITGLRGTAENIVLDL